MEHFVTLERAIACPRASVSVAAETAAQVLAAAGYRRGLGFGPTSSYVRAYRPAWALVLAVLLAIPTLGLSLLLLRYRTKDHCNVVIEDGPYGVVALVSGRVPAGLPAALEAASGEYVEPPAHAGGYPQQPPPPVLLAPSGGYEASPSHTPQAILRPATQGPAFDPYPVPQYGPPGTPPPGQPPGQAGQPPAYPGQPGQPGQAPAYPGYPYATPQPQGQPVPEPEPVPMPGPVRPPSRLGPPAPPDAGREPAAHAGVNGTPAPPQALQQPHADDDPFSSTSGRVPWVGGGRPGPLPAPPGPAPAPINRPPGFPANSEPPAAAQDPGRVATAVSDASAVLRVDTGDLLELGPFCLLGREPVRRDDDPPAQLVRFEDPKLSVSKTHLAYGMDAQGLWVMDRHSTNGTTVIDTSGRRTPCTPGERHYLTPGCEVQIGQRRITVEAPGAGPA